MRAPQRTQERTDPLSADLATPLPEVPDRAAAGGADHDEPRSTGANHQAGIAAATAPATAPMRSPFNVSYGCCPDG
jgi:hypothetical protein